MLCSPIFGLCLHLKLWLPSPFYKKNINRNINWQAEPDGEPAVEGVLQGPQGLQGQVHQEKTRSVVSSSSREV